MRAFGSWKIVLCAVVFVVITMLFSIEGQVSAGTIITGGNIINQTWTPAGSPYTIQGDVTIPVGAFLTVQAGTIVEFSSTDAQASGVDPNRVEMTIHGSLNVQGTSNPVTFRAHNGTTPGTWYGIVIMEDGTASIANARILHARLGLLSKATGSGVAISAGSMFSSNQDCGVSVTSGSPLLDRVYIEGNGSGICISGMSSPTISNATVADNNSDGVRTQSSLNVTITHSTIHGNGAAGIVVSGNGTLAVSNNLLTLNSIGLSIQSANVTLTFMLNDIFGNSSFNLHNVSSLQIDAKNNWWGTTDISTIESKIYDYYDDITLGKVIYSPIATAPFFPITYVAKDALCGNKIFCFTSMQDGIDSAESFTVIEITQETYYEDVISDDPKVVTLQGGWDANFTSSSSYTTINGSITITNGTMILEYITLK
jgi:hypothetical protein